MRYFVKCKHCNQEIVEAYTEASGNKVFRHQNSSRFLGDNGFFCCFDKTKPPKTAAA